MPNKRTIVKKSYVSYGLAGGVCRLKLDNDKVVVGYGPYGEALNTRFHEGDTIAIEGQIRTEHTN